MQRSVRIFLPTSDDHGLPFGGCCWNEAIARYAAALDLELFLDHVFFALVGTLSIMPVDTAQAQSPGVNFPRLAARLSAIIGYNTTGNGNGNIRTGIHNLVLGDSGCAHETEK